MREVDEIGATCMYLALCESVLCTDITAEQLQALVSTVTCIATCVCAPRRCTASTGEGRSMLWPRRHGRGSSRLREVFVSELFYIHIYAMPEQNFKRQAPS